MCVTEENIIQCKLLYRTQLTITIVASNICGHGNCPSRRSHPNTPLTYERDSSACVVRQLALAEFPSLHVRSADASDVADADADAGGDGDAGGDADDDGVVHDAVAAAVVTCGAIAGHGRRTELPFRG